MDVRDKVLLEATRLMAARGFEGTSLQAVASAVGVRKPSVLYHFSSKAELHKAVLERLLARWNDVLPRLLMASAQTGLARFDAVTTELLGFFAEDPDRARLLLRELLDRPEEMRATLDRFVRPWIEVIANFIRQGQEAGQIRRDVDPEVYVMQVAMMSLSGVASIECMGVLLPADQRREQTERGVHELVRMARVSLFEPGYLAHHHKKHTMGAD